MPYTFRKEPGKFVELQRVSGATEPEVTQVLRYACRGCDVITPQKVVKLLAEILGKQPIDFRTAWSYDKSLHELLANVGLFMGSFADVPCFCDSIAPEYKVNGHLHTMDCSWALSDPVMAPLVFVLRTGGLKHVPAVDSTVDSIITSYMELAEMISDTWGIDLENCRTLIEFAVRTIALKVELPSSSDGDYATLLKACERMRSVVYVASCDKASGQPFFFCLRDATNTVDSHVKSSVEFVKCEPDYEASKKRLHAT
jgi:hypothetical protein